MSNNWGRNYNANRNQNYAQVYGNGSLENWTNYGFYNDSRGDSQSQYTSPFSPSGPYGEGTYHGNSYLPRNTEQGQSTFYNVELDSETLARAANSQLTPTAGEFVPSASFHSLTSQSSDYQNGHSSYNSRRGQSGRISSRPQTATEARASDLRDNNHFRRNVDKPKNKNTDNRRQMSIEQSKAEGRKKLLQEAAGVVSTKSHDACSSRGNTSSYDQPNVQSREFGEQSNLSASQNSEYKGYSRFRRHEYYQPQKRSPPRKTKPTQSQKERYQSTSKEVDDAVSQRDRLTEQLNRGTLECLVCCECVRPADATWSCPKCYHVMHLGCIITWAGTSKSESGWRCPACQNVTVDMPKDYYCFCGKVVRPDWSPSDTAHSCGETCDRRRLLASEYYSCIHRCTLLCHPGPCPPCATFVTRNCGCGRSSQSVQCGQVQPLMCGAVCDKPLSCGLHICTEQCHFGPCQPCQVAIKQSCHCGKESREAQCDGKVSEKEMFSCGARCEGELSCGQHQCERACHEGPCGTCPRDPARITHCHCGHTPLTDEQRRVSCLDPIPNCTSVCCKPLPCGQPSKPHQCKGICHDNSCPPCELTTLVRCRCGFMDREIPCIELTSKADDARCQKKCTKKRLCGKHKCNQLCCIDADHVCPLPCNHTLSCGLHRCEQLCHRGPCQPCLQSSFEELFCECGSSVLLPPVPCGTKPPLCKKPCSRSHECDHEVLHTCHSYSECPPCGALTTKYCHGKHELRKAVPCHVKEFSCGRPCGQELACGRHKCVQLCHSGPCPAACRQPCAKPRDLCGHSCNNPCHDRDCPDTPCKQKVVVTCECGHRSMSRPCYENNSEYQRIATSLLASKMADVQLGRSVNLEDMQSSRKAITIKSLECTEECRVIERNRRLAIGLQIRNPDLSAKLTPRYSDFMRGWAKKDQRFCQHVHDKLTELVKLAKESKQKSRSYSFDTMNREKRQFVHEYCTHFGCESVAYDAEPKRNVVATAQRDKAWLPSYSLLEVVQREMGLRKVPLPNFNSTCQKSASQSDVLPVKMAQVRTVPDADGDGDIDYFDYKS